MEITLDHINELTKHGIYFGVVGPEGCGDLTPEGIIEVLRLGTDAFFAQEYDIPLERYLIHKEAQESRQCQGTTKKGSRCKVGITPLWTVKEFTNSDAYCARHKNQALTSKTQGRA